jgi:hypothetical protein
LPLQLKGRDAVGVGGGDMGGEKPGLQRQVAAVHSRAGVRRWLDGVFFDAKGAPMKTTYALKALPALGTAAKKRYWYYTSKPKRQTGPGRCLFSNSSLYLRRSRQVV